jgi:hypothetical protein
VFVDGKECGVRLLRVEHKEQKIARYDLAAYECALGHRTYFLIEPKDPANNKTRPSKIYAQIRRSLADIPEQIYELARRLREMEHQSRFSAL